MRSPGADSKKELKIAGLVAAAIVAIWLLLGGVAYKSATEWAARGQFGDMFGAANSLFSALAVAGVVLAIMMQRKELRYQLEELARSARAQEENQRILTRQIEASMLQSVFQVTKDLKLEALHDDDLHPLVFNTAEHTRDAGKRHVLLRLLVNHYYTIFRHNTMGAIPATYWDDVARDARSFFTEMIDRAQWDSVKGAYAADFQGFVEGFYPRKDMAGRQS
jgi:hypothetical protein